MASLIVLIIKFIAVLIMGSLFCLFLLLMSRDALCDDIKENTGRNIFKNKKKKNKKYPNRIKWFFLWGYISKITRWRYILFIIQIPFSIATVVIVAIIISWGGNQLLRDLFAVSFSVISFIVVVLLSIPWRGYYN